MTIQSPSTASLLACALATATPLVVVGCADSAVDTPTWSEHVQPVLAANCSRCHSIPAQGGAPAGFRLDRYHDTELVDGTIILGAAAMSRFVAVRAGTMGDMPPNAQLAGAQRDTLLNWWRNANTMGEGVLPAVGEKRDNHPPLRERQRSFQTGPTSRPSK